MSELNLNPAVSTELSGMVGSGGRNTATGPLSATTGAPAGTDRARTEPGTPANPFAALLSGILQGTQTLSPATEALASDSTALHAELPTAAAADTAAPLTLLAGAGLPTAPPDAASTPESDYIYGNALPATGKMLPAAGSGDTAANLSTSTNAAESQDTPGSAEARLAAGSRPGVSLADLAYARQLQDAPGRVTPDPTDGTRSAAAMAFAGRSLASARQAALEPAGLTPLQALDPDAPVNLQPVIATAAISTDDLTLRSSVSDLMRNLMAPGAGAEFMGRQVAAFAAGQDGRPATPAGESPNAAGVNSSALLFRHLGATTLPGLQPLGDPGAFSTGLADRLLMLGGPGAHSARLKLYPEHLGEVKVDIQIDDSSAEVRFAAASPQAREAIEASLPRLRELFAEQGIQLTRAEVDSGASQAGHPGSDQARHQAGDSAARRETAWRQPASNSPVSGPALAAATGASRLLDVWA